MIFLYGALAALGLFLLLILVRTLRFRPRHTQRSESAPCPLDGEAAVAALAALVRCRTVSRYTEEEEDGVEFERLIGLLPTLYPHLTAACPMQRFPGRGLLFCWRGKSPAPATVLMAHYDVVPAEEAAWAVPPFEGTVTDGRLFGRGTLDTKATVNGILFAVNTMIAEGYVPAHDVYIALSGSEEVGGAGAPSIVEYFEKEGIEVALVLDEGGAIVSGAFPGVRVPTAMVGIAEKGMMDVRYRVEGTGGHASAPLRHTSVGLLSRACTRIEGHPLPMRISPPVRRMLDTLGRHSSFFYRMIFANLFVFAPLLDLFAKKSGGELNALLRTTVAFTRMKGSDANNVLPPSAEMVSNVRIVPGDTVEGTLSRLKKRIGDGRVELSLLNANEPSRTSCTEGAGWEALRETIAEVWPRAVITPYLMVQCSDSRHWGRLSDRVYRFSGMSLTKEERATIHGHNESIRTEEAARVAEFYIRLLHRC
ncbi:MAG: M20/M25/M40 family metallo-hydrolase [Clostridia bacterium]|nr:M20/M25/M40 family metallo-hydrolase [Clostridia bacterium]